MRLLNSFSREKDVGGALQMKDEESYWVAEDWPRITPPRTWQPAHLRLLCAGLDPVIPHQ